MKRSCNTNPHTLRHGFATGLYRDTGKIRLVQKALGHANLPTTMVYTHIHDPEVEEALKSFRQATAVTVTVRMVTGKTRCNLLV